jgi:hypothetical protein
VVVVAHVFVLEVLEQLELTVCALGEHWSAEGLHDLLDGDILAGKLISGGTVEGTLSQLLLLETRSGARARTVGRETHQTRPKAPMPTGWRSEYLRIERVIKSGRSHRRVQPYLEVISNVVPKIWARTNSAMVKVCPERGGFGTRVARCEFVS